MNDITKSRSETDNAKIMDIILYLPRDKGCDLRSVSLLTFWNLKISNKNMVVLPTTYIFRNIVVIELFLIITF